MHKLLKNNLKIIGNDEDLYLIEIVERGKAEINSLMGLDVNFSEKKYEALLIDYCRYAYNNATEYFESNFSSSLLRLQLQAAIKDGADKNERTVPS